MMTRREFLIGGGAAAAAMMNTPLVVAKVPGMETPAPQPANGFRTITYNVQECLGWGLVPESKARLAFAQPQIATRIALELALYRPDIVTIIEAPDEPVVAEIAGQLDMKYVYFGPRDNGAFLTRHAIVESINRPGKNGAEAPDELQRRLFGRVTVDTPVGPLIVYSAHITARDQKKRQTEQKEIIGIIDDDIQANRSMILQGDLNHTPDWPEYKQWVQAGLIDAFSKKGSGSPLTHGPAKPMLRIDYIWVHGPIAERLTECRVLFEGAFRQNVDDRASFALSDHLPVMATFA